ncbi:hypothetical protein CPB85DRAFT_1376403 [Mucidula mucida]|nr:hypothetical protein CPB85DRAFT_1376403 [Mucidula mucida]
MSTRHIFAGTVILSVDPTATALLFEEKGKRCDFCHTKSPSLLRCKGCASYYYCDANCQTLHWKRVHKRMCKAFNSWSASSGYQSLPAHEKMNLLLCSHLMSTMGTSDGLEDPRSELNLVISMMRDPSCVVPAVDICPLSGRYSANQRKLWDQLYQRFGRNNFALHSHYTTYAHGIYPLASRVFNHSCVPNAAAKYIIERGAPVRMEIVALADIAEGEEIFITYMDPALIQKRIETLGYTYGFLCDCLSCKYFQSFGNWDMQAIPHPPRNFSPMLITLKEFMPCTSLELFSGKRMLPETLRFVFNEDFLTSMTKSFSDQSHDGPFPRALVTGEIVLWVYKLIYPENYPQIGMHLLELAKTAWNAMMTSDEDSQQVEVLMNQRPVDVFRNYLEAARKNLMVIGEEGDQGGPLEEIQILEDNLATTLASLGIKLT